LLRERGLTPKVGWEREGAAPFSAVEVELGLLFGFSRVDEGQGRRVALVEALES
jgi:hypothetical protein